MKQEIRINFASRREKGWCDLIRYCKRNHLGSLYCFCVGPNMWFGLVEAWRTSRLVLYSLPRGAGAIPESTSKYSVGAASRHPTISLMVSLRTV